MKRWNNWWPKSSIVAALKATRWDGRVLELLTLFKHNLFALSHALHGNPVKPTSIICFRPHNSSLCVCFILMLWLRKFQSAASLVGEPDYGCLFCSVIIWGANSKPRSSGSVLATHWKRSVIQATQRWSDYWWLAVRHCKWKQREWCLLQWCKSEKVGHCESAKSNQDESFVGLHHSPVYVLN